MIVKKEHKACVKLAKEMNSEFVKIGRGNDLSLNKK